MSPSTYAVVEAVVATYQESGGPVTRADVADSLAVPAGSLEHRFESLREFELVEPTGDGYRPTVTARELLELDAEPDDVLVLDLVDE